MEDNVSTASRESLLYLAKLAERSERFEDMMEYMKQVALLSGELSVDERNMFSVAYKNVIGARRSSWRIVSLLEQKETNASMNDNEQANTHLAAIKDYQRKIEQELETISRDVLAILGDSLLPKATSGECKVFYYKMRGDYFRYLAEFLTGDRRKEAAEESLSNYQSATDLAAAHLATTNPLRLGLALNFSVFFFEIMDVPERARQLAKQAFDEAIAQLDSLSEESYKDSTLIMQLLRDNLTLWSSDMEDSAAEVVPAVANDAAVALEVTPKQPTA